jgi:SAM-dependent methyltransferase
MSILKKFRFNFMNSKQLANIDDGSAELNLSDTNQESIHAWWDRAHKNDALIWLSGYSGPEIWERLEVDPLLSPKAVVLNIGVGLGYCTHALSGRGCTIHALDISDVALNRVRSIATPWLADNVASLPINTFDVALSHLVVQHMLDDALLPQMKAVIKSLKPNGIFALQFAKYTDKQSQNKPITSMAAKGGGVLRTVEAMESMAIEAGGEIALSVPKEFSETGGWAWHESGWAWHVIHIRRRL